MIPADFFSHSLKKKLFRRESHFALSASFPFSVEKLPSLAQSLEAQFRDVLQADHIENLKGRDRGQSVVIPNRPNLFADAVESEIFFLSGKIFLERKDLLSDEPEEFTEKLVQEEEESLEEHEFLFRITAPFKTFPEPRDIFFRIEKNVFPLILQEESLSEILNNYSVEIRELRFALQEFHVLRSFFGPSPTATDQVLLDARNGELRVLLESERLAPEAALPLPRSESGRKVLECLEEEDLEIVSRL